MILADVAIHIIGGEKYIESEAANIMRLYMTFALLYPLDRFFALTLDVIHQPKINFIKVLIMLAGSVVASVTAIYITGSVYGVAIAGVVPTLIGVAIGYWGLNRFEPFSILSIFTTGYAEAVGLVKIWWGKLRVNKAHQ